MTVHTPTTILLAAGSLIPAPISSPMSPILHTRTGFLLCPFLILDIPSLFALFFRADAVTASQKKAVQVHTVLLVFVSLFHGVSVCIGGHFKF